MFAYCLNNPASYFDSNGNNAATADINGGRGFSSGFTGAGYGGCGIPIPYISPFFVDQFEEYANRIKAWAEAQNEKNYRDHSVYVLKDPNDHYLVKYVGRTNDPVRREKEHKRDTNHPQRRDYVMIVVRTGLTEEQAIIWEQVLISAYTLLYLENARREIAVKNVPKFQSYVNSVTEIFTGIPENGIIDFISRR